MARKIYLTGGKYALVDDSDYEWLSQWKWQYSKRFGYAERTVHQNGKSRKKRMHQVIMGEPPEGMEIDHIDGNKLNNQRSNLRFVTRSQNNMNAKKRVNTTSRYKGVHFERYTGKWRAAIIVDGKKVSLGRFCSEIEAAKAYNEAAIKYFGDFARLNVFDEGVDFLN